MEYVTTGVLIWRMILVIHTICQGNWTPKSWKLLLMVQLNKSIWNFTPDRVWLPKFFLTKYSAPGEFKKENKLETIKRRPIPSLHIVIHFWLFHQSEHLFGACRLSCLVVYLSASSVLLFLETTELINCNSWCRNLSLFLNDILKQLML